MAQNDMKPDYSSSEEDEEEETSGSEDEHTSGSESDEISDTDSGEKPKQEPKKALISPPKSGNKPQAPDLSETGESVSDTSSDSDSDTDLPPKKSAVVDPNVKPISSKPMERVVRNAEIKLVKKDGSKSISTPPPANSKRPPPAPTANDKDAKKASQNTANAEHKKALIAPSQSANETLASDSCSSEAEESGSDTDSDSDSPPKKSTVADPNIKPISSKPMERVGRNVEIKLVKKDGSKSISTPPPAKSKRPPPSPTENEKDAKKAKQNTANGEPKKALIAPSKSANKLEAPDLSSSEPEESGSDTDSDSPPKKSTVADPNIKSISSKPMEQEKPNLESKLAKKYGSKTIPTPPPAKSKPPPSPAPAKKSTATDDDSKKQLFQRLWSEDDEIAILEGMIAYKNEKNGENPIADMGAFHEFIKKSLHVDVSRSQLVDKVRRLKKKYVNNASREKDGKDRSFSKSHEQKGYELSKLIWGSNSNSDKIGTESKKSQSQKNGNSKSKSKSNGVDDDQKSMMEVEKKIDVSRFVRYGGMNDSPVLTEEIVKAGMELVDGSKRAELELKWKKLKEEELVLYVKRMELLKEQALVVLEAINSSGN